MYEEEAVPEEVEVEVTDVVSEWTKFLKKQYKRELAELAREYPHKRSLYIDYRKILNNKLAFELLRVPGKVISDIKDAIIQNRLIKLKDGREPTEINVRFVNLPQKVNARDIRADQINAFVSIEGILRKTTEVRPRLVDAVFRCKACGKNTDPIPQNYSRFEEPDFCPHCERKTKMDLVLNRCRFVDAQKIRIQESPEGLRGGEQPQTLDIDATDDMTGMVAPGDRVVVNGILRSIQRVNYGQKSTLFDIYVECNSIEVAEKEFEEVDISEEDEEAIRSLARDGSIYKKISRSIAPTIYGTDDVKEAIALQLFGGIAKEMPDGSRLRGDIHLLLVGDPGIAKSQILRYVVKLLAPRDLHERQVVHLRRSDRNGREGRVRRRPLDARGRSARPCGHGCRSRRRDGQDGEGGPERSARGDGTTIYQRGKSRDHGDAEVAVRPPRCGEPEARPVRPVRPDRRADQYAALAPLPVRPHLRDGRSARTPTRRGDREPHRQDARGRRAH